MATCAGNHQETISPRILPKLSASGVIACCCMMHVHILLAISCTWVRNVCPSAFWKVRRVKTDIQTQSEYEILVCWWNYVDVSKRGRIRQPFKSKASPQSDQCPLCRRFSCALWSSMYKTATSLVSSFCVLCTVIPFSSIGEVVTCELCIKTLHFSTNLLHSQSFLYIRASACKTWTGGDEV